MNAAAVILETAQADLAGAAAHLALDRFERALEEELCAPPPPPRRTALNPQLLTRA